MTMRYTYLGDKLSYYELARMMYIMRYCLPVFDMALPAAPYVKCVPAVDGLIALTYDTPLYPVLLRYWAQQIERYMKRPDTMLGAGATYGCQQVNVKIEIGLGGSYIYVPNPKKIGLHFYVVINHSGLIFWQTWQPDDVFEQYRQHKLEWRAWQIAPVQQSKPVQKRLL